MVVKGEPITGMNISLDSLPESRITQVRIHRQECQPDKRETQHNNKYQPTDLEVYVLEGRT